MGKTNIEIYHDCIELTFGESVFTLDRDEFGLPVFPESVKEKLPPYLPESVTQVTRKLLRQSGDQNVGQSIYQTIDHELWCAETTGHGRCNCNPVLNEPTTEKRSWTSGDGKLTCSMCDESSTGYIRCDLVEDTIGLRWERLWTEGGDRFYWILEKDESKTILCEDCLRRIMAELGVEFPDVLEYDDSSPTGSRKLVN
jgi:hypothetical protein